MDETLLIQIAIIGTFGLLGLGILSAIIAGIKTLDSSVCLCLHVCLSFCSHGHERLGAFKVIGWLSRTMVCSSTTSMGIMSRLRLGAPYSTSR